MRTFSLDPAISAALWISIKASALLGFAAIVQAVMYGRTSAAMRHLVWTLAIIGVLLLPILSLALPEWVVIRSAATKAADAAPVIDSVEHAALARPYAPLAESIESAPVARPAVGIHLAASLPARRTGFRGQASLPACTRPACWSC